MPRCHEPPNVMPRIPGAWRCRRRLSGYRESAVVAIAEQIGDRYSLRVHRRSVLPGMDQRRLVNALISLSTHTFTPENGKRSFYYDVVFNRLLHRKRRHAIFRHGNTPWRIASTVTADWLTGRESLGIRSSYQTDSNIVAAGQQSIPLSALGPIFRYSPTNYRTDILIRPMMRTGVILWSSLRRVPSFGTNAVETSSLLQTMTEPVRVPAVALMNIHHDVASPPVRLSIPQTVKPA